MGCLFSKKERPLQCKLIPDIEQCAYDMFESNFEYLNPICNNSPYRIIQEDNINKRVYII
jgi:hypothetical protein